MSIEQQQEILLLHKMYTETPRNRIKENLKSEINKSGHKITEIAKETGIATQSIYQLRKPYANYCPEFIPTLILCNYLKIPITAVIQP